MPLKLSIISPSYNQADFVNQTLRSVSRQDYAEIEHIVQDAGSTDGTLELLRAYAADEKRARVFMERDKGQSDAINRGFERASGEILAWLNTDDYYVDDHVVSDVMRVFDTRPGVDLVYGRGRFVSPNGQIIRDAFINANPGALGHRFVSSVGILQPATFFRRRLIREFGSIDSGLDCAFDYELWVRFVTNGARFHFLDRVLANATFHENAKSSALRIRQLLESAEVTKRHFRFASAEWIIHAVNCDFLGRNGIVDQDGARKATAEAKDLMEQTSKALFRRFNACNSARLALIATPDLPDYRKSRNLASETGLANLARVIATTFDNAYIEQGLTLIRSVRRYESTSTPILVYDLNLSGRNIRLISQFENVHVIKYPEDAVTSYPDFLQPKNYGYKCTAIRDASRFVIKGGTVLWLDAGVAVIASLDPVFDVVSDEHVFFVNHDDKPNWPFYNGTFCHPIAARGLKATTEELLGEHLCSCLIGYRKGGRFQALIDDADRYARIKSIIVWSKHPASDGAPGDPTGSRPPMTHVARRFAQDAQAIGPAQAEDVSRALGYLGHRQDQTVFSILAARYKAPIQSAMIYCRSDDASSRASKLNWESGSVSRAVRVSRDIPGHISGALTYHHRGTYVEKIRLPIDRRGSETLVILGNGPSLKGFDFGKLRKFDAIGMNAAYRFWDEIGWYPRYYICLDKVVGLSHKDQIARLIRERASNGIECFVLRRNLIDVLPGDITSPDCVFDFDKLLETLDLFAPMPITTGSHAALFGALLGYDRMILMGVDCNYVEKVAGAEEKGGTVLELAETPASNPNYFFEGYQVAGDKYNIPNPTPELHLESWRAVAPVLAGRGVKVWNGSQISLVDAFPKRNFSEVEREEIAYQQAESGALDEVGVFNRDKHANLDETQIVAALLGKKGDSGKAMIDVGAHFGTTLAPFLNCGWRVFAFEPDDSNRQKLQERLAKHPGASQVKLDSRAVSNESRKDVSFYSSEISTGISGLSGFHPSHREAKQVDTVTLQEALAGESLPSVDFLKIDTEGHDLFVLQGFPWERFKPAVIECEFEDEKTVPLGYHFHDLAKYLVEKQYSVYVSEWHPVIRYGIRHDWKRLMRYPCDLSDAKAWGNLLAFREPVDEGALVEAVKKVMKVGAAIPVAAAVAGKAISPAKPAAPGSRPLSRKVKPVPRPARRPKPAGGKVRLPKIERRSNTLVILGNGPSLRSFDFRKLKGFDAIGMNAAYRYWDQIGWYPRYYVCLDLVMGMHHKDQITRLIRDRATNGMECFLLRRNLIDALPRNIALLPCVLNFDALSPTLDIFSPKPVTTGSHAALFGVLLGYDRMVLMGIDCNYVQKVEGAEPRGGTVLELVRTPASNPNYFFNQYQVAGDRFNIPDPTPELHLESWRKIAPVLAARGISVWNGSPRSRLDLFPKLDFSEIERQEAAFRSDRVVVRMDRLPAGGNWHAPEFREDWGRFRWTGPDARATLELPLKRNRGNLAVMTYHPPLLEEQLAALHVEVDGVRVPHAVRDDVEPRCIVVRVPERPSSPGGTTELALVLPRTVSPASLPGGGADQRLLGLPVSSISVIPGEPHLPVKFPVSRFAAWRRLAGQADRNADAADFPLSHFDGRAYLEANPDVAEAVVAGRVPSGLEHYRALDRKECRRFALASARQPNEGSMADLFDGFAYLGANPDVADAVRAGIVPSALDHFIGHGRQQGRRPFIRYDGEVSRGTAPELMRLDAIREARSELHELKRKLKGEIETRTWAIRQELQHGLTGRARPADVARVEKFAGDQIRKLKQEGTAMAAGRDARTQVLRAQVDALKSDLGKARDELGRLRGELASLAGAREKREQALLAQIDSLKAEINAAKTRAEQAEAKREQAHLARIDALKAEISAAKTRAELAVGKREQALLARIDALKAEISAAKTRAELAEAKAASAQQGLAAKAQQVAGSLSDLQAGLSAEKAGAAKVRAELEAVKSQAAATSARISHANLDAFNVLGYQAHSRALTKASAGRFSRHWAPLLGLDVQEKELYYLAHRVCSLENACVGRLAASVDSMLLRILVAQAIKSRNLEIMEIGTLFGLGVGALHEALAPRFKQVQFTVIDPLDGYYGAKNRDILTGVPVSRTVFDENLRRAGVDTDSVTVIQLPSTAPKALQQARRKRYDMLVIDGDHTYKGVKNDAEKFVGTVKPGGYVVFDDYGNQHWPDVKRYVDAEVMSRAKLKFVGAEWHTAVFQVAGPSVASRR